MSTPTDYTEQIAKGVALLDEKVPDWLERIDLDTLDMRSVDYPLSPLDACPEVGRVGCGCVLAQIDYDPNKPGCEGNYQRYASRCLGLDTTPTKDTENAAWRYGFTVPSSLVSPNATDAEFTAAIDALTDAWKATILRLRAEREAK